MDYEGMMEQILMESKIMQDRASIVRKVEPDQDDFPLQADNNPLPEPNIPANPPVEPDQDNIPLQAVNNPLPEPNIPANPPVEPDQDDIPLPGPDIPANPAVPIMEFRVFKDREFSDVPKGLEDLPGYTIFNEPPAWPSMVSNLSYQGYEGNADLYYITPGCVPPEGMVLISCQEHVDEMMQALDGRNKCDLYIVTNCPYSGSEDDYGSEDGMNEQGQHTQVHW